jgi:hypothetical protein
MTDNNVVDLLGREEAIFRARLMGKSIRSIAQEFHCEIAHVQAVIDRRCRPIDEHLRKHTLLIELERLDELEKVFAQKARNGDAQATLIILQIAERRAAYHGRE